MADIKIRGSDGVCNNGLAFVDNICIVISIVWIGRPLKTLQDYCLLPIPFARQLLLHKLLRPGLQLLQSQHVVMRDCFPPLLPEPVHILRYTQQRGGNYSRTRSPAGGHSVCWFISSRNRIRHIANKAASCRHVPAEITDIILVFPMA